MVKIEDKQKAIVHNYYLGQLVKHTNGKVGMITFIPHLGEEMKICVFAEEYNSHTDTEARWAKKSVVPFTGKITIQNT